MDNKLELTVEVVTAYLSENTLRHDLVPEFMDMVYAKVEELAAKAPTPQNSAKAKPLTEYMYGKFDYEV